MSTGGSPALDFLREESEFTGWAMSLPRLVLRSRTSFSWHLFQTLFIESHGSAMITAALPLPVPFPGCFRGGGPGLSKRRLRILAQKRLVHLIVLVIDYLFLGRFPSEDELRRSPNAIQAKIIEELYARVAASGYRSEAMSMVPGRSGSELIARLDELERYLEKCLPFSGGYEAEDRFWLACSKKEADARAEEFPQLRPYRNLDVSRLKISGDGSWPLDSFLDGVLWLPYVEPRVLHHHLDMQHMSFPSFAAESREEYLALTKKWDELGLLRLHLPEDGEEGLARIFNTYKSREWDRQIGDRRKANSMERSISGPSSNLPPGPSLLSIFCLRGSHSLRGSVTDRRDFYHQALVTPEKSRWNGIPFVFDQEELGGLTALGEFHRDFGESVSRRREDVGDRLGMEKAKKFARYEGPLRPSFKALYQGDHLGVEFALQAHEGLLKKEGLLVPENRLQGHENYPVSGTWEGLIIDDYFCISSQEKMKDAMDSDAYRFLSSARGAYERHSLPGSVEKDVVAASLFKAAGAEVDSTERLTSAGFAMVGAPLQKRLALSAISLRAAGLPGISTKLAAKLSGSWVSVLLYRRSASAVVDGLFALGSRSESADDNWVVPLTRGVAQELCFLSILAPILSSDVSAPFSQEVLATDASMRKGAIVRKRVEKDVSVALWLSGDKKGAYTMLDRPTAVWLKELEEEPFFEHDEEDRRLFPFEDSPERPPEFFFDFVEVCGGAAVISKAMLEKGCVVAPSLDLSDSKRYNLTDLRLVEWIMHMLKERRFASAMFEPPCTTFSPAAHPMCRSYSCPVGWDRTLPKVFLGNMLAFRCIALFWFSLDLYIPSGLEQPRRSKMCWLSQWKAMLKRGAVEAIVASCQFGSVHQKEFRFLLSVVQAADVERRCGGGHHHVKIEGKLTKPSATYTPQLAEHLAVAFVKALAHSRREEREEQIPSGFQGVLVDDVLRVGGWKEERSWFWKNQSHINVLEVSAVLSALKQQLQKERRIRLNVLIDSMVAKGALAKGRSSARTLCPVMKRVAAVVLAGDFYVSYNYAATKLNVADDPTRDRSLREGAQTSVSHYVGVEELRDRRMNFLSPGVSGWIRLTILLVGSTGVGASSRVGILEEVPHDFDFWKLPVVFGISLSLIFICSLLWTFLVYLPSSSSAISRPSAERHLPHPLSCHRNRFSGLLFFTVVCLTLPVRAPMVPQTQTERDRASMRSHLHLNADRVVRHETHDRRYQLLEEFWNWLWVEHSISREDLLDARPTDAEAVSGWLVKYGRELHAAGKGYNKYSETVNAIAMVKPSLKRQLTGAWDLAFSWLQDEPHRHFPAMPLTVMVSLVTVALIWGWPVEAALISTMWVGILRVGEALDALRADLILPSESAPGVNYVILRIREPKTRGRGARHQSTRIEPKDTVELVSAVFRNFSPEDKLWRHSASTLRKRFNQLLQAVGLPLTDGSGQKVFELGSLRPGGATHMLTVTEDASLVQRRGRWASMQVMNIYLQEVAIATCTPSLSAEVRSKIERLCGIYPTVLEQSIGFLNFKIPCSAWNLLFQRQI